MSLKAKVEAIIYAAEEPVTLEQIALLLKDIVLADLAAARENAAIEQADFAAEALAMESGRFAAEAAESAFLPELDSDSAELSSPEPGPLMPEHAAGPESAEENRAEEAAPASEAAPESRGQSGSEEIAAPSPARTPAPDVESGSAPEALSGQTPTTEPPGESASASVNQADTASRKRQPKKTAKEIAEDRAVRERIWDILVELVTGYASEDRGMEIRQVAGGFRMATKPEHHDVVRAFAKSLKPPIRLSLAALETLAVIAYKQPITAPEIADIRGVESASVLGTLLDRKLITTAGRKQVIGRPMQYKTSKDFLLRFGLNDVNELPSMEEFSQLASGGIEIAPLERQETLFEPTPSEASPDSGAPFKPAVSLGGDLDSPTSPADQPPAPNSPSSEAAPSQPSENAPPDEQSQTPEPQPPGAADAADSQPQSEADSGNIPEAGHPIGK